jgi:chemotaxis-related protein WspD
VSQACWNSIGVRGDGSCPELDQYVHCRNCPVYSRAGQALLDRPLSAADIAERTAQFATPKVTAQATTESVVIFRIAAEWLALSLTVVEEIAPVRAVHSLPHRRDGAVLGVTNVRGELLVCVSLEHLLSLERSPDMNAAPHHAVHKRLLVVRRDDTRAVCPADEVHGIYRVRAGELQNVPVTVAKAAGRHARAVLSWRGHSVGVLDDQLLFYTLQRSLA